MIHLPKSWFNHSYFPGWCQLLKSPEAGNQGNQQNTREQWCPACCYGATTTALETMATTRTIWCTAPHWKVLNSSTIPFKVVI